jgi:hypothetical protein
LKTHKIWIAAVKPRWMEQDLIKCRNTDSFKAEYRKFRRGNQTADNNVRRPCEIRFTGAFCREIWNITGGRSKQFLWQVTHVRCGKVWHSPPPRSCSSSACPQLQELPLIQKRESFMSDTTTCTGHSAPWTLFLSFFLSFFLLQPQKEDSYRHSGQTVQSNKASNWYC